MLERRRGGQPVLHVQHIVCRCCWVQLDLAIPGHQHGHDLGNRWWFLEVLCISWKLWAFLLRVLSRLGRQRQWPPWAPGAIALLRQKCNHASLVNNFGKVYLIPQRRHIPTSWVPSSTQGSFRTSLAKRETCIQNKRSEVPTTTYFHTDLMIPHKTQSPLSCISFEPKSSALNSQNPK